MKDCCKHSTRSKKCIRDKDKKVFNLPRKFTKKLTEANLLNDQIINQKQEFHVSDYTESFEQSAHHFFGKRINLKETRLF